MTRKRLTAAGAALLPLFLLACGATATASGAPSGSASPGAGRGGGFARNGAFGQLVQINGQTLIVSATTGDTSVTYSTTTRIQKSATGTFADVSVGMCAVVTGAKDASGNVTATSVRLSAASAGTCAAGRPGGGGGFGGARPGGPSPNPNLALVSGLVTAVSGASVTIQPATGAAATVSMATTVPVTITNAAAASDLAVGECVAATGQKDSAGTVAARTITITPPSASGACTRPGFGGGGFGGGGGGGAPATIG